MSQPVPAPKATTPLIRPDTVDKLPFLADNEKEMFRTGLTKVWAVLDDAGADAAKKEQAQNKIREVSAALMIRMAKHNNKAPPRPSSAQSGQQPGQQAPRPPQAMATPMAAGSAPVRASPAAQASQPGPASAQQAPITQQPPQVPQPVTAAQQSQPNARPFQLSQQIQQVITNFRVFPPPHLHPQNNAAEFDAYRTQFKQNLQTCLVNTERCQIRMRELALQEAKLQQVGQQLSADLQRQKEQLPRVLANTQAELGKIKTENDKHKQHWTALQARASTDQNANNPSAQTTQAQQVRPPGATQLPATQQAPLQQTGQTQMTAAQPQQPAAGQPNAVVNRAQVPNPTAAPQPTAVTATSGAAISRPPSSQQQGPAQSTGPQTGPTALSTSTSQRGTPSQTAGGPPATPTTTTSMPSVNQKMPIPAKLTVATPTPVSMGPSRPTFGGLGGNGPPGMIGQPAMTKPPGFILEGESERVLSKKKLDELVRQVTGGGEGDGLTPDVEEVSWAAAALTLNYALKGILT